MFSLTGIPNQSEISNAPATPDGSNTNSIEGNKNKTMPIGKVSMNPSSFTDATTEQNVIYDTDWFKDPFDVLLDDSFAGPTSSQPPRPVTNLHDIDDYDVIGFSQNGGGHDHSDNSHSGGNVYDPFGSGYDAVNINYPPDQFMVSGENGDGSQQVYWW